MPSSPLQALVYCNDAQSLCTIDRVCSETDIASDVCLTSSAALKSLKNKRFDLLVLDFDDPGAIALLDTPAGSGLSFPNIVITFARSFEALKRAQQKRVHFVLQTPFTPALMARTIKASHSLLVKERRAAFRHAVKIKASAHTLEDGNKRELNNPVLLDISHTGLCLQTNISVPKEATITVVFQLPETQDTIHVTGKVMWSGANGHAGVLFQFIPPQELRRLRDWLNGKCPWNMEMIPVMAPYHTNATL